MKEPNRFDALVIGSGLAGLTFALDAAQWGRVGVVTKAELYESNTTYAQGGIAAAVGETDSWELHEQDTLLAGAGLCDADAVRFLVQEAPASIEWLASLGARFDRDSDPGSLTEWALGREGGHSRNRIVKHADKTGWEIERAMNDAVRRHPNISIYENSLATSLLMSEARCVGAVVRSGEGEMRDFIAGSVMLATGGCGKLYQHTTNPRIATADGIALAARVGACVLDMEFMQFHPTTLYHPQMRSFLITEAVRGEGGTLRDHLGNRFMYDFDERLELAPRDIVSRAIDAHMRRLETWCVYLDMTHLSRKQIFDHFPTICERLATVGIEPHRHWIPVVPAQHYSCGGVVTDQRGHTGVPGLYAAGEVARTGVHGANRLASNSLLEALVYARAAARAAGDDRAEVGNYEKSDEIRCVAESSAIRIRRSLQKVMMDEVGIVRRDAGLAHAATRLEELWQEWESLPTAPFSPYAFETTNLFAAARYVIRGAQCRRVNVGLHFNADLQSSG